VEAGGVFEASREGLGEDGNRSTHEDGTGHDQEGGQEDVDCEADAAASLRDREGERLDGSKQQRKRQGVDADARLDEPVENQESGWAVGGPGACDASSRDRVIAPKSE
jgi:hypothetical protein